MVGLFDGLVIGILGTILSRIPIIGYAPLIITLTMGYAGAVVAIKKKEELLPLFKLSSKVQDRSKSGRLSHRTPCKILDTSVIIDGRIADICKTGFIEGILLVPNFVLEELQHIADSSDMLKRNRGRRGLDILNKMRKESNVTSKSGTIRNKAKSTPGSCGWPKAGGKVITNNYNLNKVAELMGISAEHQRTTNAIKPVVLPGEGVITVIKDGKEQGQGVGYLDDGTMIVVDEAAQVYWEPSASWSQASCERRGPFAKPKAMERAL